MDQQQSKLNQLAAIIGHPLKLLREGGRLGLNIIKKAIPTILLFATVNTVAIVIAVIRAIGAMQQNLLHLIGSTAIAVVAMGIVFWMVYSMVRAQLSLVVYNLSMNYLQKLSDSIVAKVKQAAPTVAINKVVDINRMVHESYSLIPAPLRNLVTFFINQVPMVGIISASRTAIVEQNQQKASEFLFRSLNLSIRDALERKLGQLRTLLVLLINIILQFLLINGMA